MQHSQNFEGYECCIALSKDIQINSERFFSCFESLLLHTHKHVQQYHFLHKLEPHTTVSLSLEYPGSKCLSPTINFQMTSINGRVFCLYTS
jgi:hypothetical protein